MTVARERTSPKIEGGTHFDFYVRPEYVGPAIAEIEAFLKQHL